MAEAERGPAAVRPGAAARSPAPRQRRKGGRGRGGCREGGGRPPWARGTPGSVVRGGARLRSASGRRGKDGKPFEKNTKGHLAEDPGAQGMPYREGSKGEGSPAAGGKLQLHPAGSCSSWNREPALLEAKASLVLLNLLTPTGLGDQQKPPPHETLWHKPSSLLLHKPQRAAQAAFSVLHTFIRFRAGQITKCTKWRPHYQKQDCG